MTLIRLVLLVLAVMLLSHGLAHALVITGSARDPQPVIVVNSAITVPVSGSVSVTSQTREVSTLNSSTTNLTLVSSEFNGIGEDVLGYDVVDVSLYADQGILVEVFQSDDNLHWDLDDPLIFNSGVPDSFSIRIVKRYIKIRAALNDFLGSTTFFRLSTVYSPDNNGLPRTLFAEGGLPVTGAFYPSVQPVSGTFYPVTQTVAGYVTATVQGSVPVTGTFFQTTQPVSLATAPTTPVTGTFWQTTQPISGSVSVSNLPVNQPVTGTVSVSNFPASQAVTGTFWPVNQPVTGTVSVSNFPTTYAVSTSGLWNVGLNTGSNTIGAVNQGTGGTSAWKVDNSNVTQTVTGSVSVSNFPVTYAVSTSGTWNVGLNTGSNTIGTVNDTPPALTKSTQGSTGFSVQSLLDAGRTAMSYYTTTATAGLTGVETLLTLTKSSGTTAVTNTTSYTPTSAKQFRITELIVGARGNLLVTMAQTTTFNFRVNAGGTCTAASTPIIFQARVATPAIAGAYDRYSVPIPAGYELNGNGTLTWCVSASAIYNNSGPTWDVNVLGFEY